MTTTESIRFSSTDEAARQKGVSLLKQYEFSAKGMQAIHDAYHSTNPVIRAVVRNLVKWIGPS